MRKLLKLFGRGTTGAALGVFVTAVGCEPRKKAADSPSGALSQARGPGMAELAVNVMPRELVSQNAASSILSRWEREVDFDVSSAYMSSLPVDVAVSSALEGSSYPFKGEPSPGVPFVGNVMSASVDAANANVAYAEAKDDVLLAILALRNAMGH